MRPVVSTGSTLFDWRYVAMPCRTNHRKPLPQPGAEAGARVRLQEMQRGGKLLGVRLSAVDTRTSDPEGDVVI